MKVFLTALLLTLAPTAPQVPKDLAIRLPIKACNGSSVADTSKGSYVQTGSADRMVWDVPIRLSRGEKQKLDRLIVESGFLDLPTVLPDYSPQVLTEPGPDDITLTVRRGGYERTIGWYAVAPAPAQGNPGLAVRQRLDKLIGDISRIFYDMPAVKRIPPRASLCL